MFQVLIRWPRTIRQIDETTFTVERMTIDVDGGPQPTGELNEVDPILWTAIRPCYVRLPPTWTPHSTR